MQLKPLKNKQINKTEEAALDTYISNRYVGILNSKPLFQEKYTAASFDSRYLIYWDSVQSKG